MSEMYKAAAKAIKAKGLQKLRFWCEVCHKQCRDACGYRNHCTTEGHLRQMKLFSHNASSYISQYSREFERTFMNLLRRKYRFNTVLANRVYNEFIQDREHVHMNATRWVTLTAFVHYLNRTGKVQVSESSEGLLIRYIDRDPVREAQQEAVRSRERMELSQEQRQQLMISRRIRAYQQLNANHTDVDESQEPSNETSPEPIKIDLTPLKRNSINLAPMGTKKTAPMVRDQNVTSDCVSDPAITPWLHAGIVVKIKNRDIAGGILYGRRARILYLLDDNPYAAVARPFVNTGDKPLPKLQIDQADTEVSIPRVGSPILIVQGMYRGKRAILRAVNTRSRNVVVGLDSKEIDQQQTKADSLYDVSLNFSDVCEVYQLEKLGDQTP